MKNRQTYCASASSTPNRWSAVIARATAAAACRPSRRRAPIMSDKSSPDTCVVINSAVAALCVFPDNSPPPTARAATSAEHTKRVR